MIACQMLDTYRSDVTCGASQTSKVYSRATLAPVAFWADTPLGHFDLVFLDLNMPDIGGFEVLEFVRSQDTLREVPIIVVTTRGDEGSRGRSLEAGATRFMTKPFEPAQILAELRSLRGATP